MQGATLRTYFRDLSWVGAGIGAALGINYVFYVLVGNLLGPESFGIFGAVMAVYYIMVGAPVRVLEFVSKRVEAEGRNAVAAMLRPTVQGGVLIWAAFFLFAPVISTAIDIPLLVLRLFAFTFPAAYLVPVLLGRIHGQERFREYALYEIIAAIARFAGIGLILAGFGVFGAVMGPILELGVGALLLYYLLRPLSGSASFHDRQMLTASTAFIVSVYTAFSIDILLLNIFHPAELVGQYSSVAVLGKALFFSAVAVNRAVFPKFIKRTAAQQRLLWTALLLIAGAGAMAILFFHLFGAVFLRLTFGAAYGAAAGFAPLYMVFITLVSLLALFGNYYLATDDTRIWLFFLLPLFQVVGILLFHTSVQQIIFAGIGAAIMTTLLLHIYPAFTSQADT